MIFAHLISALPIDTSTLESSISALESAISALESEVKALEISSAPWERSLPWATAVVVVGLLMEFWVIRHERLDDWHAFGLGIVRLADRPSTRKYVIELLSVLFITLGVFCEFAIGLKIASVNKALRGKSAELRSMNGDLRSKSDQLLALVTQEAGNAQTSSDLAAAASLRAENSSTEAGVQAGIAERRAEEVGKQADDLQTRVNAADKQVEQLRKDNNESAAKLETERAKRLELATSLLPRDFWNQSGAIAKLSGFPPPTSVVFVYRDEHEIIETAEQIAAVMDVLHWKFWRWHAHETLVKDGTVECWRALPAASSHMLMDIIIGEKRCEAITEALNDSGIDAEVGPTTSLLPPMTIMLGIGSKANRAVEEAVKELARPSPKPIPAGRLTMSHVRRSIPDMPPTEIPK